MKEEELMHTIDLFKLQGFKTPEELFLVGYVMAHGGERLMLEIMTQNANLLERCGHLDIWLPIIKDEINIHVKVNEDDVLLAHKMLKTMLESRKADIPEWLTKATNDQAKQGTEFDPLPR